jgi:hypothetical protein
MRSRKVALLASVMALSLLLGNAVWGAQGDKIWEKTISFTNFTPSYNQVITMGTMACPVALIVAGNAKNQDNSNGQIAFVKALNVDTGDQKWEWIVTLGTTNSINGFGFNGNLFLVRVLSITPSGQAPPAPMFSLYRMTTRAYNPDTGDLVWEKTEDNFNPQILTIPTTPLFQSLLNRYFTTGIYFDPVTGPVQPPATLVVRGYQVRNVALQTQLLLD